MQGTCSSKFSTACLVALMTIIADGNMGPRQATCNNPYWGAMSCLGHVNPCIIQENSTWLSENLTTTLHSMQGSTFRNHSTMCSCGASPCAQMVCRAALQRRRNSQLLLQVQWSSRQSQHDSLWFLIRPRQYLKASLYKTPNGVVFSFFFSF